MSSSQTSSVLSAVAFETDPARLETYYRENTNDNLVLATLAKNIHTPFDVLYEIITAQPVDDNIRVYQTILKRPFLDETLVELIMERYVNVLKEKQVSKSILGATKRVLAQIATLPTLTPATEQVLLDTGFIKVAKALAKNPHITDATYELLREHQDAVVREEALANPKMKIEKLIQYLYKSSQLDYGDKLALMSNPLLTVEVLPQIISDMEKNQEVSGLGTLIIYPHHTAETRKMLVEAGFKVDKGKGQERFLASLLAALSYIKEPEIMVMIYHRLLEGTRHIMSPRVFFDTLFTDPFTPYPLKVRLKVDGKISDRATDKINPQVWRAKLEQEALTHLPFTSEVIKTLPTIWLEEAVAGIGFEN